MVQSKFSIDVEGKDTWRHKNAGADFVISMSDGELAFIQKIRKRATFSDVMEFVPKDTEILICEGLVEEGVSMLKVIASKTPELLEETLETRGVGSGIIALSGIMANEVDEHCDYPVFDCLEPEGARKLADLILKSA